MPRPPRFCVIDGCTDRQVGRGWCRKHYTRWNRYGDPSHVETMPKRGVCTIAGCHQPQKAHGWCETHYRRWQRHGDPSFMARIRNTGTPEDRWWVDVLVQPKGCWLWQGQVGKDGRGDFSLHGKWVSAHRWGFQRFVGPIPEGLELDHLCRTPICVRFDHLEPVTHLENVRRAVPYIKRRRKP